jgi:hypothetical protein
VSLRRSERTGSKAEKELRYRLAGVPGIPSFYELVRTRDTRACSVRRAKGGAMPQKSPAKGGAEFVQ